MNKPKKFTFKTERPEGRYRSFYPDRHYIKYNGTQCGMIIDREWKIRLQVIKAELNEDKNLNCDWKWVQLAYQGKNLQDCKDFLNTHIDAIFHKHTIKIK